MFYSDLRSKFLSWENGVLQYPLRKPTLQILLSIFLSHVKIFLPSQTAEASLFHTIIC